MRVYSISAHRGVCRLRRPGQSSGRAPRYRRANQGTATTLLHGNAVGQPSFTAVLDADITSAYSGAGAASYPDGPRTPRQRPAADQRSSASSARAHSPFASADCAEGERWAGSRPAPDPYPWQGKPGSGCVTRLPRKHLNHGRAGPRTVRGRDTKIHAEVAELPVGVLGRRYCPRADTKAGSCGAQGEKHACSQCFGTTISG